MAQTYNSTQVYNFVKAFLLSSYDTPVPIPPFHKEIWDLALSGNKKVAVAAPRGHAKSTSVTYALTLFLFLFRVKRYGLIISDTESQASQFLVNIKTALIENELLIKSFGVKRILKDAVTDIIVEMNDGYTFRISAFGAEQKVRGRLWRNLRPDYVVVDDLENDEVVESDDRRSKLKDWFLKALLPALSPKKGSILVIGTILHMDSLLMNLMTNIEKGKGWKGKLYKAHNGFDDFGGALWPEYYSEADLREKRQEYIEQGRSDGYAQEYLNDPTQHDEAFFKKPDFKEIEDEMKKAPLTYYAGMDLAISDADKSAYTVIVIGGMDSEKRLHIKQVVRFRGDANEIIEQMFQIQQLYGIDVWKVEDGQISKTLMGPILDRMNTTGVYLNIIPGVPTKDKRSRARAIQARMRAGGVYFNKDSEWFPGFEQELLQFPKGMYKDQVDAIAWLGIAINELSEGPTSKELEDEDYETEMENFREFNTQGRNLVTGY